MTWYRLEVEEFDANSAAIIVIPALGVGKSLKSKTTSCSGYVKHKPQDSVFL